MNQLWDYAMSIVLTKRSIESIDSLVVLNEVSWQTYIELRESDLNRNVRMTFDRGKLFLMSPGKLHERIGAILAQIICVWTELHDIPRLSGGSTTMKHPLINRGLEPDKCFYIQNEFAVRHSDTYDAETDLPPDLVVEVDVTSLSTVRMPIYAEFGVPEIWRWHEEKLEVHRLQDNSYVRVEESFCLPGFPFDKAIKALIERHDLVETSLLVGFRKRCQVDSK